MTKQQAHELAQALQCIESGLVSKGVTLLRAILRDAGYPAPPFIIATREGKRDAQGNER